MRESKTGSRIKNAVYIILKVGLNKAIGSYQLHSCGRRNYWHNEALQRSEKVRSRISNQQKLSVSCKYGRCLIIWSKTKKTSCRNRCVTSAGTEQCKRNRWTHKETQLIIDLQTLRHKIKGFKGVIKRYIQIATIYREKKNRNLEMKINEAYSPFVERLADIRQRI